MHFFVNLKGNRRDAGKPVLSTRQFLNIGDPSPSDGSTPERFASAVNFEKQIGRNLAYMHNGEGEINSQITSEEAKRKEDQATEFPCRKARVSIRARSDFSSVRTSISFYIIIIIKVSFDKSKYSYNFQLQ